MQISEANRSPAHLNVSACMFLPICPPVFLFVLSPLITAATQHRLLLLPGRSCIIIAPNMAAARLRPARHHHSSKTGPNGILLRDFVQALARHQIALQHHSQDGDNDG